MSDQIAPWLERWGLELEGRPPPPGGREPYPGAGEVAFVRRGARQLVLKLLPQVFAWAREAHPAQPLTSGVWQGDWSSPATLSAMSRVQIENSDVISFHNYGWPEVFEQHVEWLEQYHRPLICTEYMARGAGSTFDTILPIAQKHRVAAINWGLAAGKTQTWLPWDSWYRPYTLEEPTVWFHDIFYPDGKPYRQHEADQIRELTMESNGATK